MKVTLSFRTEQLIEPDWLCAINGYFEGKFTALEACALIGCDRHDWDTAISGIASVVVRQHYKQGMESQQANTGCIEVGVTTEREKP